MSNELFLDPNASVEPYVAVLGGASTLPFENESLLRGFDFELFDRRWAWHLVLWPLERLPEARALVQNEKLKRD